MLRQQSSRRRACSPPERGSHEGPSESLRSRVPVHCKFHNTRRGCRAGETCPFLHVANPSSSSCQDQEQQSKKKLGKNVTVPVSVPPSARSADGMRDDIQTREAVTKLIGSTSAQQVDARMLEIKQVERKLQPVQVSENDHVTVLALKLIPSDPDFPFQLEDDGLHILLKVPKDYRQPRAAHRSDAGALPGPSIRVTNPEIERGFQINIERGFDSLVVAVEQQKNYSSGPTPSLLSLLDELDKNLEAFLTVPKAQTIKIVAYHDKKGLSSNPNPNPNPNPNLIPHPPPPHVHAHALVHAHTHTHPVNVVTPQQSRVHHAPLPSTPPRHTAQQKAEAHDRRESELGQLEARLRNLPGFGRHRDGADGATFNVPLTIPKPGRLPSALYSLKETTLTVPLLYPLQPCSIKLTGLKDGDGAAATLTQVVEAAFVQHVIQHSQLTLMAHINHLTHNVHLMVKGQDEQKQQRQPEAKLNLSSASASASIPQPSQPPQQKSEQEEPPHVFVIPRPPEWDHRSDDDDDEEEESSDFGSDITADSEEEQEQDKDDGGGGAKLDTSALGNSNNSVLLSLPNIELYGIELLEIASCSLSVRCLRCKTIIDLNNLKAKTSSTTTTVSDACPKCSVVLSASNFTAEPVHANSIKLGHFELTGCTVVDMLPSVFQPTCSACSTPLGVPPGVVAVRGDTSLSVCRACHQKMTFRIPEVKFLRVSSAADALAVPVRKKKTKNNDLGIVAGTPLPNFGRCAHYRKSHRWFRFSCCQKVYACDKCHDEQQQPIKEGGEATGTKHPNEHANRMICGYCSREQNYRPNDCGICRASLVGKRAGGFWEGGKGTRDKVKMSRKDPRKYKKK